MKSEVLDYVLDSMMGIIQSLWSDEEYKMFKEENPGLKWDLPTFEDTIHAFCNNNPGKELMIKKIVYFIKENELVEKQG